MTCIAGIVHKGTVTIGGDSAFCTEYQQIDICQPTKVFRRGDMIFGCSGYVRAMELLRYALVIPPYATDDVLERYLVVDFVNAVRTCLKDGGIAQKKDEREQGTTCLFGFRGRLFHLGSDYCISESTSGYKAIGAGDDVAYGVLHATRGMKHSARQRIEFALEAASHHIDSVRPPFVIECLEAGE